MADNRSGHENPRMDMQKLARMWDNCSASYLRHHADAANARPLDPNRKFVIDPCMKILCQSYCVQGSTVLDVGCGDGYFARKALAWGAKHVIGVDISGRMIEAARSNSPPAIRYVHGDLSEIPGALIPEEGFDLVVSYLSLLSSPALYDLVESCADRLAPTGRFIAATKHPCFLTDIDRRAVLLDGVPISDGLTAENFRYFDSISYVSSIEESTPNDPASHIPMFHYSLECYCEAMRNAGLLLERLVEPRPAKPLPDGSKFERPKFLIICARKDVNHHV